MNNMTVDPNQENRPSVFSFDPYPLGGQPIDWSRGTYPPASPLIPPGQFNPSLSYQQSHVGLGNFSFCTTQTPSPVLFPFPTSPTTEHVQNHLHKASVSLRCKRRTESPPLQVCKQHITEEKMAEHMSRLHISSETATSSKETETERTQRLYMCEEMRKLQSDTILPQSLLSKIQRPCTALVLWQPPRRLIPLEHLDHQNENNNEEAAPDQNQMAEEVTMESDMNNMELDNV